MLPLAGIRVLDLSQLIAGPAAATLLADYGADVVKVESPGGDRSRHLSGRLDADIEPSIMFRTYNYSKRFVELDLRIATDRDVLLRLVDGADVFLESSRPGALVGLGLGPEVLLARNPRLVYASVSAFGWEGESAHRRGVDIVVQAESGIMSSTGYPGGDPTKVGFPIVDAATAHALCHGIMAALLRRERSGSGGVVRVSLFDMAVALQAFPLNQFLTTGEQEQRSGNSATYSAPADLFHCRDGSIVISANTDGLWRRLAETIGVAHLAADPRFATNADRVRNRRELIELINERLSEQDVATWIERLQQTGLVVGWVADYDAVTASLRRRRNGPLAALGGSAFVIRNPIELVGTEQPPAHLPVAAVATDLTWLDASEQQPERP